MNSNIRIFLILICFGLLINNLRFLRTQNVDLPDPVSQITSSVHIDDNKNEDAWTVIVTEDSVQVQVVDTRTIILFRPPKQNMNRFREGSIAAITFQCDKGFNDDCDLSEPYQLYANNTKVELLAIKFKDK